MNLSEVILTPEWFCPFMGICDGDEQYSKITADSYIEQILSDKPEYLMNDDYIDKLYIDLN